jgi:hypothetical protein
VIVRTVVERDLKTLQLMLIPETAVEKAVLRVIDVGTQFIARRNGDDEETVVFVPTDQPTPGTMVPVEDVKKYLTCNALTNRVNPI